jgi:hypothetical protein
VRALDDEVAIDADTCRAGLGEHLNLACTVEAMFRT